MAAQNAAVKDGVLAIIEQIFDEKIEPSYKPIHEVKEGEVVYGVVTSKPARRIIELRNKQVDEARRIAGEHLQAHYSGDTHNCAGFRREMQRLEKLCDLLDDLFWVAVLGEHQNAIGAGELTIRKGWKAAGRKTEVQVSHTLGSEKNALSDYMTELSMVIRHPTLLHNEKMFVELDPVGEGETVVGTVDDVRIKALYSLAFKVSNACRQMLPDDVSIEALLKLSVEEVSRLSLAKAYATAVTDITMDIFWEAVRDAMPADKDLSRIGIRSGWQVVQTPPVPGEESALSEFLTSGKATIVIRSRR